MECPTIMAVILENRRDDAPDVQEVFTRFGGAVRVRLGVHDVDGSGNQGLILLQLCCEDSEVEDMLQTLNGMARVHARAMKLDF